MNVILWGNVVVFFGLFIVWSKSDVPNFVVKMLWLSAGFANLQVLWDLK